MQTLQGIAVSPGVAIGEALVIDNEGFRIPRRFVMRDVVEDEVERLTKAIDSVAGEIDRDRAAIAEKHLRLKHGSRPSAGRRSGGKRGRKNHTRVCV